MSIELKGNWKLGFAYDIHTLDSVYMGGDEQGRGHWQTTRSEMGELLYRLKYQADASAIPNIVALLGKFKGLETMNAIIPVPSSKKTRRIQPVQAIASTLGEKLNVTVLSNALVQQGNSQELKNIDDPAERENLLRERLQWTAEYDLKGQNVLLLDDLYRSGTTLKVATEVLYQQARVKNVLVLTMTKTRSKR